MAKKETAADLIAQARRDYGSPAERAERAAEARVQSGLARAHAAEAAQAPRGQR